MARKFTVKDVEDGARLILLDTYEDAYRFEPKEVFAATSDALERVRLARPASRYVGNIMVDAESELDIPSTFTDESLAAFRNTEIQMGRRWMEAVIFYVVHKMYLKDDPDTKNDSLAQKYLELFNGALG